MPRDLMRALKISLAHPIHHSQCDCLAYSAECCVPTCECHEESGDDGK